MIVKALSALILIFIIWPIALGVCLGFKKNIDRYIIGFCAVQALFFVMYIPAILFAWSSRALAFSATTVITSISIIGVLIRYRNASSLHELLSIGKPNFSYLKNPFFIIAITIVLYEMWTYAVKEPYIYGDDDTYIRLVTNIVDTNTIYLKDWTGQIEPNLLSNYSFKSVFTSYYPFLSSISILSGLHPLILCKTVIPLVYLPIHYLIVLRIGLYLFDSSVDNKTDKLSVFMFFYSILIEWGLISYYTISRRLTIWIYNSKSDCFCILLLSLFFYTYYLLIDQENSEGILNCSRGVWRQLIVVVIALACNSATLMGVVLSAITIGIWLLIGALRYKKLVFFFRNLWMLVPHILTLALLLQFTGYSFA